MPKAAIASPSQAIVTRACAESLAIDEQIVEADQRDKRRMSPVRLAGEWIGFIPKPPEIRPEKQTEKERNAAYLEQRLGAHPKIARLII